MSDHLVQYTKPQGANSNCPYKKKLSKSQHAKDTANSLYIHMQIGKHIVIAHPCKPRVHKTKKLNIKRQNCT